MRSQHMHRFLCVAVWLLHWKSFDCLPPSNCEYTEAPSNLRCVDTDLNIPVNFDVTLVPDVEYLTLGCPSQELQTYCNTLRDSCEPVPARPALRKVYLNGFKSDRESARPAFGKLLRNVKHHITSLHICYSRIGSLDSDLFSGFRALEVLNLEKNDIQSIDSNVFQSLATTASLGSALKTLSFNYNKLEEFDWSVLQPVRRNLERLELCCQNPGLRSLTLSGSEFQVSLLRLDLHLNELVNIPQTILGSVIAPQSKEFFHTLYGNNFCSKADCSCCEMEPFVRWVTSLYRHTTGKVVFDCGTTSIKGATDFAMRISLGRYNRC